MAIIMLKKADVFGIIILEAISTLKNSLKDMKNVNHL